MLTNAQQQEDASKVSAVVITEDNFKSINSIKAHTAAHSHYINESFPDDLINSAQIADRLIDKNQTQIK
ncbi:hypothetical protein [Serratia proteamaculans]|uniref:hypothetical protein n=1 Tax=Serratia proteamaculans TaxID=28151 RepID=UPI0028EC72A6|nr:hypothetical protein [Serratia proteamaculans]